MRVLNLFSYHLSRRGLAGDGFVAEVGDVTVGPLVAKLRRPAGIPINLAALPCRCPYSPGEGPPKGKKAVFSGR